MHYSNPSRGSRSQATKMSAHSVSALRERYNLRQRTENPFDSRFQMPSARQIAHNFPSSHSRGMADSLKKYTTRVKKSSTYSPDSAVLDSSPFLPSQSHSAHTYSRDVSPSYKQRRANTSPSPMEDLDDSVYNALNQQRIDHSSSPFLSMRNSQKQFQTSTDDVLNYHQPYYPYPGAELSKNTLLSKASAAARLKASHISGNLGLKTDYEPPDDFDLDGSPEAPLSNKAFHAQLQFQKMDFKVDNIFLSPNWVFLLSKYYDDVLNVLKSKLRENIDLYLNPGIATLRCVHVDLVKSLLENDLTMIDHDFNQQSLLKAKVKKWENLIDSLHNKFFCVIISEEDFSKTYVCTTAAESESILSEIAKFLDQGPSDIKISPHVMEFVRHNKEFSDLKLEETAQDGIWIRSIRKPRLAKLKAEIRKVTCQSYLLDENQYEVLCKEKKEVLSYVEKRFQVKGSPYQLPIVGDMPVVFQVNPLTSISCAVNSDPENIPMNSLISVDWQTPQSTAEYKTIDMNKIEKYKILEYVSWNLPMYHIGLLVPEINKKKTTYSWNLLFKKCLKMVLKNGTFPHTIGISIPIEISEHLVEFCQNILTAVKDLPQNYERPIYILLFVKTSKMMTEVVNILKTPSLLPESDETPLYTAQEECTVDVITGLITEQEVDVVVSSVYKTLALHLGAVSSALLNAAGPALQEECNRKYPNGLIFPEIAITKGYNLPCNYVFHGALPTNNGHPNICTFVENCLQKAAENTLSSIAFPALGTGSLKYKPQNAAAQMAAAIKKFKAKTHKSSLKKIIIVIYPDTKGMDDFFELQSQFAKAKDSKGAVPKRKPESPLQKEQKQAPNWIYKPLQWILFSNYSTKRETLDDAIMEFEKRFKNVTFPVSFDEAQELFFFYDLISLVPDIVQQLDLMEDNLFVPEGSLDQLERYLTEFREQGHTAIFHFPTGMKISHLEHFLIKIRQKYPKVKCEITNNSLDVLFKAPNFDHVQKAKSLLESCFGFRENISTYQDRFNADQQDSSEFNRAKVLASSKNDDINTFKIADGFLVKVYKGDILNVDVDGIVNAANNRLSHGGGVALAIINAAGDAVKREGQEKLDGKTLNDGEVLSTSAGNLKRYKNIIHAVGPRYTTSLDYCRRKVADAVYNSLTEANRLGLGSVALPAISSAIFGVPLDVCTSGYFMGVKEFCQKKTPNCQLKEVHIIDLNPDKCKVIKDYFGKQLNSLNIPNQGKPEDIIKNDEKMCPICLEELSNPYALKCKHRYCLECVKKLTQPLCPVCRVPFGTVHGTQLDGSMTVSEMFGSLPGFYNMKIYSIAYTMGNGMQKTTRIAYLPKSKKGDVILKMLQLAFRQQLIFTVGESRTTGAQNVITWNEIHHKTSMYGGPSNFGYPDPDYFTRVTKELADKGITPDLVANKTIEKSICIQNGKIISGI